MNCDFFFSCRFLSGKNCGASNFNLLAMLVHFGNSLDSGHYAAFVKRDNKVNNILRYSYSTLINYCSKSI